jgi:hypothetical protein
LVEASLVREDGNVPVVGGGVCLTKRLAVSKNSMLVAQV